jgi:RNA polymerase-binding transcription factor DksA
MDFTDDIARRLKSRLAELEVALRHAEAEPLDADFAEQANQLEDLETDEALDAAHVKEARAISAALARIADGSYGTCVNCGAEIPQARLEAQPTAARCIACAS